MHVLKMRQKVCGQANKLTMCSTQACFIEFVLSRYVSLSVFVVVPFLPCRSRVVEAAFFYVVRQ